MKKDKIISKMLDWLADAENSTSELTWRDEAKEDYQFYAGKQDTAEILELLEEQGRVAATFNEVKPKIDMLIGMAAQSKWDVQMLPKGKEDEALAELGTGVLKHFRDKLGLTDIEIDMFEHTVKSGRSFLYFYVDAENPFKPEVKVKRYPGEHVWVDPDSIEYDLSDAKYIFIEKWLTEQAINRYWPSVELDQLRGNLYNNKLSFFNEANQLYRVIECWYRDYEKLVWFIDPISGKEQSLSRADFAAYDRSLQEGVEIQGETVRTQSPLQGQESWVQVIKYCHFSGDNLLASGNSPYTFLPKTLPIVLCGAYKNDDENYWFSVVNQMKDPQRSKNTLNRQLLHLLQTLPKGILMHEAGSILNIEEYETRAADPSYHMELARGGLEKVRFQQQPPISPVYQMLDQAYGESMKNSSGIQNELMGVQTTSREPGVTVRARQETGVAVIFLLFNNYKRSRKAASEIFFRLLQQYVREPTIIRVENEKGRRLMEINSQTNPQSEGFNDIAALEYDLVLDDSVYTATMRQAVAQVLTDYSHQNPGSVPPDLILDYSSVPFSAKERMRQFYEAQQQAAAEAAQAEERRKDAELALKEEEIKIKRAEALGKIAEARDKAVTERSTQKEKE